MLSALPRKRSQRPVRVSSLDPPSSDPRSRLGVVQGWGSRIHDPSRKDGPTLTGGLGWGPKRARDTLRTTGLALWFWEEGDGGVTVSRRRVTEGTVAPFLPVPSPTRG